MKLKPKIRRTADISPCGKFRYSLTRTWEIGLPVVTFVMLNPSVANAEIDDPTIRRCMGFARSWGFGGIVVKNLYPYRATKPMDLFLAMKVMDVTGGSRGDQELRNLEGLVIAAWGAHATEEAIKRFARLSAPSPVYCLCQLRVKSKRRQGLIIPAHPLFLPSDLTPVEYLRCDKRPDWRVYLEMAAA